MASSKRRIITWEVKPPKKPPKKDVIKSADYVIDMGPDGGVGGGKIVANGTPEEIGKAKHSHTAKYLARTLRKK